MRPDIVGTANGENCPYHQPSQKPKVFLYELNRGLYKKTTYR